MSSSACGATAGGLRNSLVLLGSRMSHWVPMTLLAAMAAVDLLAQYTVAATDLPQLLGISGRIIRFLQVSSLSLGLTRTDQNAEPHWRLGCQPIC